jgi:hypothetical protein
MRRLTEVVGGQSALLPPPRNSTLPFLRSSIRSCAEVAELAACGQDK